MAKRRFVLREGDSDKFWEIAAEGAAITVHWGRSGTKGRELRKELASEAAAAAHVEKLVREKIAGGYAEERDGEAGMTGEIFWSLISLLDARHAGDEEAVVAPLIRALSRRPIAEIAAFDDILAEKMHTLDGERFARETGEAAFRGDGRDFHQDPFVYARACVIANGRALYERVLADPTSMPKDAEFEALLYVASQAHEEKTGEPYPHVPATNYETFANWAQWPSLQRGA